MYAIKQAIKNWERIKKGRANGLLLSSHKDALKRNLPWIKGIKLTLEKHGMLNFYMDDFAGKPPFIRKILVQRLSDNFHQNSFESIKSETSKLRTYGIFKKEIGFENYLVEIKNLAVRTQVTKFRLSNHHLMIEVGRHKGTPKDLRFCPFCPRYVENEFHFLLDCSIYNNQREIFIKPLTETIPGFIYPLLKK